MTTSSPDELGSAAQRDRRRRILDAAASLASQGGFEAVRMRGVAERAEVALGTLYRYFPSKIHLLVSALARRLEEAQAADAGTPVPGTTAADRVLHVLGRATGGMQADPRLTEALIRAFVFADASVSDEIQVVGTQLTAMLAHAIRGEEYVEGEPPAEEEIAVAGVIGDVWLATLVAWVTGRATTEQVTDRIETAVRLLLR